MVNQEKYTRESKKKMLQGLEKAVNDELRSLDNTVKDVDRAQEVRKGTSKNGVKILLLVVAIIIIAAWRFGFYKEEAVEYCYVGPLMSSDVNYPGLLDMPSPEVRRKCEVGDLSSEIKADSYMALYVDSYQIIAQKNVDDMRSFASMVKLLGALVALDYYDLSQELALLEDVDTQGNGLGLEVGESLSVQDLLGATLVGSKNDAMYVLVQNYPGGHEAFISAVNKKAEILGLENTSVVNPVGFDNDAQYSTTRDIAALAVQALRNSIVAHLVSQPFYNLTSSTGREETIWTTNSLLGDVNGVVGVKTGFTEDAGQCLVVYVDDECDFITIVM
ncbi:MAG: hypothetical protein U9Q67_05100, partial [Patescibacteria group bacterium]|nr:hypothetical protein [Patescibacteria group bacterium]